MEKILELLAVVVTAYLIGSIPTGYIIVKADGEVLAYHIYNRNFFEQYLLDNTICERASTGRHEYMSLYEEGGQMYIKLNLQVRFK